MNGSIIETHSTLSRSPFQGYNANANTGDKIFSHTMSKQLTLKMGTTSLYELHYVLWELILHTRMTKSLAISHIIDCVHRCWHGNMQHWCCQCWCCESTDHVAVLTLLTLLTHVTTHSTAPLCSSDCNGSSQIMITSSCPHTILHTAANILHMPISMQILSLFWLTLKEAWNINVECRRTSTFTQI